MGMNKQILQDYIDACELVKETEKDIQRLNQKKRTIIQTNVKGSMKGFPYTEQHFKIQGSALTIKEDSQLRMEEKLLRQRKEAAEKRKIEVEEWMLTIPFRIQRIIRLKYFEDLSWEQVAIKIGKKATADSVRMELDRFFQKK